MKILITMKEASKLVDLPYMAIRKLVLDGDLNSKRIGRLYYVNSVELLNYLNITKEQLKAKEE